MDKNSHQVKKDRHIYTECPDCHKKVRPKLMEKHRAVHERQGRRGHTIIIPGQYRRWFCPRCGETISYSAHRNHMDRCNKVFSRINDSLIKKYGPLPAGLLVTPGQTPGQMLQTPGSASTESGSQPAPEETKEEEA